jgi:hypothetical protein
LGFDEGFQVILKDLGKVVLKFRSTEIFEDFGPVWRVLILDVVLDI